MVTRPFLSRIRRHVLPSYATPYGAAYDAMAYGIAPVGLRNDRKFNDATCDAGCEQIRAARREADRWANRYHVTISYEVTDGSTEQHDDRATVTTSIDYPQYGLSTSEEHWMLHARSERVEDALTLARVELVPVVSDRLDGEADAERAV